MGAGMYGHLCVCVCVGAHACFAKAFMHVRTFVCVGTRACFAKAFVHVRTFMRVSVHVHALLRHLCMYVHVCVCAIACVWLCTYMLPRGSCEWY